MVKRGGKAINIKGIHILLTYECTYECDHCFLCSGPRSGGTFTLAQLEATLHEARKIGSLETVYFEGGEPFLYYPLLIAGAKKAREMGFNVGVVTNGYFATSETDALIWLKPLAEIGLSDFTVSEDRFHNPDQKNLSPAHLALKAAEKLSLHVSLLSTAAPSEIVGSAGNGSCNPVMYRGRAVEKLSRAAFSLPAGLFDECPYEDLLHPRRVHLDAFGNVHICQGLIIGNMWETKLSRILLGYRPAAHPLCGPLAEGGPLQLAETYDLPYASGYADACHFCYNLRRALLERFPRYLAPRQVYGLE